MATDPQSQDQQVTNRPDQTAPVPLPEGLQANTPVPSEFSGWNKIYVKQGDEPVGRKNLVTGGQSTTPAVDQGLGGGGGGGIAEPTHTMLTNNGDNTHEVPVSQMQAARGKGNHVAIPMQAPAPDNREGWVPLHNAMAALKAGFKHVGNYKQAMDDALNAVRDKRNDIATAAADAIARRTPNYNMMPPEIQNDLKEMVGMGVGFFTGGTMQPGMSSEEAKASGSRGVPLMGTLPPIGLSGTTIEPSEQAMQLGRVPEKPIPVERQMAGEPGPRTLEAKAVEPGVYAISAETKVPPEQSTGRPEWDEAIKKGGAIPDGFQKGAPEEGIPNYAQFHDPHTGSSMLLPEGEVTAENVASHMEKSRAQYAATAPDEEPEMEMAEKQTPLKQSYQISVTDPTGDSHRETIDAFSAQNAKKVIQKQFPDAQAFKLEAIGDRIPSTDYVVPSGKHLSMPPHPQGKTEQQTIDHELGHIMTGLNQGWDTTGMKRHTHPDLQFMGQGNIRASASWKNRTVTPEQIPGFIESLMGGVAADEIGGIDRADNKVNMDTTHPYSDAGRAFRVLRQHGIDPDRAHEIIDESIDAAKNYLTNPAVSSVIKENAPFREKNLSTQYHFSPERLNNMHAEVQRRMQNATGIEGFNNRAVSGEGAAGRTENVSGPEGASAPVTGQTVSAQGEVKPVAPKENWQNQPSNSQDEAARQATLPFGSSPEAAPAIAAAPPTQGLHPQAQDWANTVQKIAAKMGKDAAIEAGRRILGSALLDQNAANRPEIGHLDNWLNNWESTVSPKELAARMNMLEVNPLKIISGTGENPKNAEQAATAAGVRDISDISESTKKNLLSVNADAKTVKGQKKGYMTGVLYLAPDTTSGIANTCPFATEGCRKACLFTAGHAGFLPNIIPSRIDKTRFFKFDNEGFMNNLSKSVAALVRKSDREGYTPAVRLNGTSDLPWENVKGAEGKTIMEQYPNVQFYDYTKNPSRMDQYIKGGMPKNYHLTFSRSETNDAATMEILKNGGNAAIVFDTKRGRPLPTEWNGYKVIDGDETDVRFLDDKSTVIGLRAKGKAKKDTTGFVLNVKTPGTK